jgi:hypothetical protein
MARGQFKVIDVVEVLQHWHAGRPKSVVASSLDMHPKTVRKYVAKAEKLGLVPGGATLGQAEWAALVGKWFPELVGARARSLTFSVIDAHRPRIETILASNTVTTVHQRLRDEHSLAVGNLEFPVLCGRRVPRGVAAGPGDGVAWRCRAGRGGADRLRVLGNLGGSGYFAPRTPAEARQELDWKSPEPRTYRAPTPPVPFPFHLRLTRFPQPTDTQESAAVLAALYSVFLLLALGLLIWLLLGRYVVGDSTFSFLADAKVELFRSGTVATATRVRGVLVLADVAAATACVCVILHTAFAVKTRLLVRGALLAAPLFFLATVFIGPTSNYR